MTVGAVDQFKVRGKGGGLAANERREKFVDLVYRDINISNSSSFSV